MTDMRRLIHLVENTNHSFLKEISQAPTLFNREVLRKRVTIIASLLSGAPYFLRPDPTWANKLQEIVRAKQKEHEEWRELEDPEFDLVEEGLVIASQFYSRAGAVFGTVRLDVEHEIAAYQERAAERMEAEAGFDSNSHYVESSDFLTFMHRQVDLARRLDMLQLADVHEISSVMAEVEEFCRSFPISRDGQEDPVLVEGMVEGLPRLAPLVLTILRMCNSPTITP